MRGQTSKLSSFGLVVSGPKQACTHGTSSTTNSTRAVAMNLLLGLVCVTALGLLISPSLVATNGAEFRQFDQDSANCSDYTNCTSCNSAGMRFQFVCWSTNSPIATSLDSPWLSIILFFLLLLLFL